MQSKSFKIFIILLFIFISFNLRSLNTVTSAQTIEELKDKIDSHAEQIKKLDEEIKIYQNQIEVTGREANTLQNAIKILDTDQKKVTTEIKKTETNISKTNLTLNQLTQEIRTTEEKIETGRLAIANSLKNIRETDKISLVEIMLSGNSLTSVLGKYDEVETFNKSVHEKTRELLGYKSDVEVKQSETKKQKEVLVGLKTDLSDKNAILENSKREKDRLLRETKNLEAEYKKILAEKQAEKASFETALFELASQLEYVLDPSKLPTTGHGSLRWPLDNVFITQQFGRTADSGRLYTSGTHDGVDFRATISTPVKAALSGTVLEINHGAVQNCQYGKWIVLKHANGLATLYAHLSDIRVQKGQTVSTGEIIGLAGNTGYATGPHLHFTVYAAEALSFKQYTCKSGSSVVIPIASRNAYLDPIKYFPAL